MAHQSYSNDLSQDAISEIGKFTEIEREVNLNADRKRFWLDTLEVIDGKTNVSMPLPLNFISKERI